MNEIQRKQLYEVSAREKGSRSQTWWSVDVIATSPHEAKNIGVLALEKKGLICKSNIKQTSVHCTGQDVWVV